MFPQFQIPCFSLLIFATLYLPCGIEIKPSDCSVLPVTDNISENEKQAPAKRIVCVFIRRFIAKGAEICRAGRTECQAYHCLIGHGCICKLLEREWQQKWVAITLSRMAKARYPEAYYRPQLCHIHASLSRAVSVIWALQQEINTLYNFLLYSLTQKHVF